MSNPAKIFSLVAQVLEAEILVGQVRDKVIDATRTLLQTTQTDPTPLLHEFSEQSQILIRGLFDQAVPA
jgi:hypothetical protein